MPDDKRQKSVVCVTENIDTHLSVAPTGDVSYEYDLYQMAVFAVSYFLVLRGGISSAPHATDTSS